VTLDALGFGVFTTQRILRIAIVVEVFRVHDPGCGRGRSR
jgi:hypothetical protein